MPAFVLVHSPLVGPATWTGVAEVLRARGDDVVVPSLVAATTTGPPFAAPAVEAVAAAVDAAGVEGPLVVAAHSGAGPLLPAIGEALGARVVCHLLVDAALPMPGRARISELHPSFRGLLTGLVRPDGTLPPWHEWWGRGAIDGFVPDPDRRAQVVAELSPIPYALFEEPLPVVPGWPAAPCAYLRLSETYAVEEAAASGMGWPVTSVHGSHLELVSAPARVAVAMLDLVARVLPT
ncbi:MAG: hypothetical protein WD232_04880 [Acidimicrobiales bacterium]